MAVSACAPPVRSSFRDPAGQVHLVDGRVLRSVHESADEVRRLLHSDVARAWVAGGQLVRTDILEEQEAENVSGLLHARGSLNTRKPPALILEHERIEFPSYPYEWAPEMLHAAGKLTLQLARDGIVRGTSLGVKDATPYNVLFRGPDPVFVDVLSFESRRPDDPTWLAYGQFTRTFLLPLLASRYFGIGLDQIFLTRRDGLEPDAVYAYLKPHQRLLPPFVSLVSMPAWLARKAENKDEQLYVKRSSRNPEMAQFILKSLFKRLDSTLDRVAPVAKKSVWSGYQTANNYTETASSAKERFVTGILKELRPRRVLDVGCNTGHFSRLAARAGASVVAIDYDPVVVGAVWKQARAEKLPILPLVVNLARPSPATGWLNSECPSFLERATGHFDCVLMLAVIHHMLVSERIPLDAILAAAASLTTGYAVIEFIEPADSMFRRLVRGRAELHKDLTVDMFENVCRGWFDIVRREPVEGSQRLLYLLRRRTEA